MAMSKTKRNKLVETRIHFQNPYVILRDFDFCCMKDVNSSNDDSLEHLPDMTGDYLFANKTRVLIGQQGWGPK